MSTRTEQAAEAERQAAVARVEERRAGPTEPMITMPFGKKRPAREYLQVTNPYKDPGRLLYESEKLLRAPETGWVYAWPDKEAVETQARIRAGIYIPISKKDLKPDAEIATHKGSDDNVYWYRHIFVKVPPHYADMLYEQPKRWAAARLAKQEDQFREQVSRESGGLAEAEIEKSLRGSGVNPGG